VRTAFVVPTNRAYDDWVVFLLMLLAFHAGRAAYG
jgi:hypothetical protein